MTMLFTLWYPKINFLATWNRLNHYFDPDQSLQPKKLYSDYLFSLPWPLFWSSNHYPKDIDILIVNCSFLSLNPQLYYLQNYKNLIADKAKIQLLLYKEEEIQPHEPSHARLRHSSRCEQARPSKTWLELIWLKHELDGFHYIPKAPEYQVPLKSKSPTQVKN